MQAGQQFRQYRPLPHSNRSPMLPYGDSLALDDLGQPVPICIAEVNVIETYLGDVLEELFASSKAGSEPERT